MSYCKNSELARVIFGWRPWWNVWGSMWGGGSAWIVCIQRCNLILYVLLAGWFMRHVRLTELRFDVCCSCLTLSVYVSVFVSVFVAVPLPQWFPTRASCTPGYPLLLFLCCYQFILLLLNYFIGFSFFPPNN